MNLPALSFNDKISPGQFVLKAPKRGFLRNVPQGVSDYQGLRNCKPAFIVKY